MKRLFFAFLLTGVVWADPFRFDAATQKIFENEVEQARQEWQVPALAVGVVHKDQLVYFHGFGQKSKSDPAPPNEDTVFAVGSTTKAFGGLTLAMAVDEKKFDWNDRVADLGVGFAMSDPWMTREFRVSELLAQHPGVAPYAMTVLSVLGYPAEDIMEAFKRQPTNGDFRLRFAYVNEPHLFAGRLLAKVWGKASWQEAVHEKVLQPLGMTRTTWTGEALQRDFNKAPGHVHVGAEIREAAPINFPYVLGMAGCLNSSVRDMSQWVRFQLGDGKPLVSPENFRFTRTPQTIIDANQQYCLGWILRQGDPRVLWHNGGTSGHTSMVMFCPRDQWGIVVLGNLGYAKLPDAVAMRFYALAYGKQEMADVLKPPPPEKPPMRPARIDLAAPLAEYAGDYTSPIFGPVQVRVNGDRLELELPRAGYRAYLEHVTGDRFEIHSINPEIVQAGYEEIGELSFARAEGKAFYEQPGLKWEMTRI